MEYNFNAKSYKKSLERNLDKLIVFTVKYGDQYRYINYSLHHPMMVHLRNNIENIPVCVHKALFSVSIEYEGISLQEMLNVLYGYRNVVYGDVLSNNPEDNFLPVREQLERLKEYIKNDIIDLDEKTFGDLDMT